jgi:hypothetical protein
MYNNNLVGTQISTHKYGLMMTTYRTKHEAWPIALREEHRFRIFENGMLNSRQRQ